MNILNLSNLTKVGITNPFKQLSDFVNNMERFGRKRRRIWKSHKRLHVEIRGLTRFDKRAFIADLEKGLNNLKGVDWAEVNSITGRVVIALTEGQEASTEEILDAIEGIEELHQVHKDKFPHQKPEHPGDIEPFNRNLMALCADILGIAAGLTGQIARFTPIPGEIASIISLIESEPRLRRILENRLGHSLTDLTLAILNSIGQGLSQGPLGLFADSFHRVNSLIELKSIRDTWEAREPELSGQRGQSRVWDTQQVSSLAPTPPGYIEKYADIAAISSLASFGTLFAISNNVRKSANLLAAGLPKAARLGREAFSSHMARILTANGLIVMNSRAIRNLDRINTVVFDATTLLTGRWQLKQIESLSEDNKVKLEKAIVALFDPNLILKKRLISGISLTIATSSSDIPRQLRLKMKFYDKSFTKIIIAHYKKELIGAALVVPEVEPNSYHVIKQAKDSGIKVIIAGKQSGAAELLDVKDTIAGGTKLGQSVLNLQNEKHVVLLIYEGNKNAGLKAANVSVGIYKKGSDVPWGADIISEPKMQQLFKIITACKYAKAVSKQSVELAAAGSITAGIWTMIGPSSNASKRATIPVNTAALLAQLNGIINALYVDKITLPKPVNITPWHSMEVADVLKTLQSNQDGLSEKLAEARLKNTQIKEPSDIERFLKSFAQELANPLTPVLAVGTILSAAIGSIADAGLVAGVTTTNALIGAIQQLQTQRSVKKLKHQAITTFSVLREGKWVKKQEKEIVIGDIVLLKDGDVAPADIRLIKTNNLEVDESSITGESMPIYKTADACYSLSVTDRNCMLYQGTTVVAGNGIGVVVATGDDTVASRAFSGIFKVNKSGVEQRLKSLMKTTIPVTILSGGATSGIAFLWRRPVKEAISSGISLMVSAVPEGLPMLANLAQLASAQRLSSRSALVKDPKSIEALGRVNVLCFDKTGTLTSGDIQIKQISDGSTIKELNSLSPRHKQALATALRATPGDSNSVEELTHATDRAIIQAGIKANVTKDFLAEGWQQLQVIGFLPSRGYHAVVGKDASNTTLICVKGAPEVVLPKCGFRSLENKEIKIDKKTRQLLLSHAEKMAKKGLRVLAVAQKVFPGNKHLDENELAQMNFLGFLGLADSVRPAAKQALNDVRKAGVDVVMITGDHPETAKAIAEELEILTNSKVLTGADIEGFSDNELEKHLINTKVFARVTPSHKTRIIQSYQRLNKIVAMTGDGANDAGAIRLADCGIAVGKRASHAAIEAADLVITDDRLETIVDSIIEGRAMWSSVKDALAILIGGNVGEAIFTIASTALTGQSSLNTRQLLLVNLMTDMLPALTIAVRPPKNRAPEDLLNEGPDNLLGKDLLNQILLRAATTASSTSLAWLIGRSTGTKKRANTIALATLVSTQLAQTIAVGGSSKAVIASSLLSGSILAIVIQTPLISNYFGCVPLDPVAWATVLGCSIAATGVSVVSPRLFQRLFKHQKYLFNSSSFNLTSSANINQLNN